jgi:nucleotide-binding universal stress UspA family protein
MPSPQIIVAAIEFDSTADPVWSLAQAMAEGRDAHVHLAHVVRGSEGYARSHPEVISKLLEDGQTQLQAWLAARLSADNPFCEQLTLGIVLGKTAEALVQVAVDVDADLLVLGTHGRKGVERLVLGSTASQVFRLAPCSVTIARTKDYHGLTKSPHIGPPGPRHDVASMEHPHTYHYHRANPYSTYNSSIYPTGTSRESIH